MHTIILLILLHIYFYPNVNITKVANRIQGILKKCRKKKPKCICFCLTKSQCTEMAELLNSGDGGITAETTTGDDNKTDEMADKIQRFRDGQTQILCATKGKEYVCI
jgi:superfamily II DNA helicase RecQ